jgi:hypothetical protein
MTQIPPYIKRIILVGILAILFAVLMFFVHRASSHGLETEQRQDVADYSVEFAYPTPELISGESATFIFRLLAKKDASAVPFDKVSTKLKNHEEVVVFAADISQDIFDGQARVILPLPKPGTYHLELEFERGKTMLAKATFPVEIIPPLKTEGASKERLWIVTLIAGFVLGALAVKLPTFLKKPEGPKV